MCEYRLGTKWLNNSFAERDLSVTADTKLNVSPKYTFTADVVKYIVGYIRRRRTNSSRLLYSHLGTGEVSF